MKNTRMDIPMINQTKLEVLKQKSLTTYIDQKLKINDSDFKNDKNNILNNSKSDLIKKDLDKLTVSKEDYDTIIQSKLKNGLGIKNIIQKTKKMEVAKVDKLKINREEFISEFLDQQKENLYGEIKLDEVKNIPLFNSNNRNKRKSSVDNDNISKKKYKN